MTLRRRHVDRQHRRVRVDRARTASPSPAPSSPQAKFTAPSAPGDYEFTLKVTGPDGSSGAVTSKTDTVIVHVNEIRTAVAKIAFANAVIAPGATITVPQNQSITLDGGQSVGAAAFSWSQVSGRPCRSARRTARR